MYKFQSMAIFFDVASIVPVSAVDCARPSRSKDFLTWMDKRNINAYVQNCFHSSFPINYSIFNSKC